MKSVLPILLTFIGVLMLSITCVQGQEKIRTVEKATKSNDEPISVIGTQVRTRQVDRQDHVRADQDWLKDLSLTVKNISDKPILYLRIYLEIEKQGVMEHPMHIQMLFGTALQPSDFPLSNDSEANKTVLQTNQITKVMIPRGIATSADKILKERNIDVERVKIIYDFVLFKDGTAWSRGDQLRPDVINDQWLRGDAPHTNSTSRLR